MKRIFFLLTLILLVACPPVAPDPVVETASDAATTGGALSPRAIPPPTGTGFVTTTAGKQDPTALTFPLLHGKGGTDVTSAGTLGNVLTSDGTNWISQAPGSTSLPFTKMWSFVDFALLDGNVWTAGNNTGGRRVQVTGTVGVTLTSVRFWAHWTGGGSRTIKARICQCTTVTCGAATSLATATASIADSTTATIAISQAMAPSKLPYLVSIYDTTATSYPAVACPVQFTQGANSCVTTDTFLPPYYSSDPSIGKTVFQMMNMFVSGDGCATSVLAGTIGSSFMAVEPIMQ